MTFTTLTRYGAMVSYSDESKIPSVVESLIQELETEEFDEPDELTPPVEAIQMSPDLLIAQHREVQNAAKSVLASLAFKISAADTELSIAETAYRELCALGFSETWYYRSQEHLPIASGSVLYI